MSLTPSNLIKPRALKAGDRLAAITLSWGGAAKYPHRFAAGKAQLEATFGVKVIPTRHALRDPGWIAQNPRARADDLHEALRDPDIAGIVAIIGGDESVRLLPYLDRALIRANPKVFLGYSDSTVTHLAFWQAGVRSFYGPTILAGFAENGGIPNYLESSVRRTLFDPKPVGPLVPNADGWTVEFLDWNQPALQAQRRRLQPNTGWKRLQGASAVRGHLLGGCIDALEFVKGTAVWPSLDDWRGAIFFWETSEEAPSPDIVKRWMRNYAAQGILSVINGMIVGRPGGEVDPGHFAEYDAALLSVVRDELGRSDLPILSGLDFGHTDPMMVLPYGAVAEISAGPHANLTILDSSVQA